MGATVDSRSHTSAHRNLRVHLTSRAELLVQGRQPNQTANAGIAAGFARPARNRSSWRFRASRPPHWLWGASPGEERVISCTPWFACVGPSGAAAHLRGGARVYSITACQSVELGANSEMEPVGRASSLRSGVLSVSESPAERTHCSQTSGLVCAVRGFACKDLGAGCPRRPPRVGGIHGAQSVASG